MNPAKVERSKVKRLTDLPNIGPAIAKDLELVGINTPAQLVGKDPVMLYRRLCKQTETRHDPCVLDVFIPVTRFMAGEAPQPWWHYTEERKHLVQV